MVIQPEDLHPSSDPVLEDPGVSRRKAALSQLNQQGLRQQEAPEIEAVVVHMVASDPLEVLPVALKSST